MSHSSESWSTQQLAEFLAAVSAFNDEDSAVRVAIERAAEALDAEAGAVLEGDAVSASIGFPAGAAPAEAVLAVTQRRNSMLEVPGVGSCETLSAPVGAGDEPSHWLVLARRGGESFTADEVNLLRGMARVLSLTLRMLRLIEGERQLREESERQADENSDLLQSLQERQSLLERLSSIQ